MNIKSVALLVVASLLAAACSSTSFSPTPVEMNDALKTITGQDGRACVRVQDISGYGTLDDTTVSVSDKFRRHYLMVTAHRCPAMETSPRAAFKGSFTEFCGQRDSLFSGGDRCLVRSIFEFENRDAAFDAHDQAEELIRSARESN